MPTVFRWYKKMEFKFHFYFSFFFGLVKWNSISISIFRFLSTCDIEKRIWISFFVFLFRITWKTDFNFTFRICVACYWKTDWSFLHEFEKWINPPLIWNSTPPPLKGMTGVMRGLSLHNHPIFPWPKNKQGSHSVVSVSIFATLLHTFLSLLAAEEIHVCFVKCLLTRLT